MKKSALFSLLLLAGGCGCLHATGNPELEQRLEGRLIRYVTIDSQSKDNKSDEFPMTDGQHRMALALQEDIEKEIAASGARNVSVTLSPFNYLYVTIPSNISSDEAPVLGFSCHLDVTPEAPGGDIRPIADVKDGRRIIRTDGTTLLGADDKCGCSILMEAMATVLADPSVPHGKLQFVFCPNEDIGRAAEKIDTALFSPDILFDLDGAGGKEITCANFTAKGFNVLFKGRDAHPADAKAERLGDATAAAATFIASVPAEYRPENTEGRQGYIHPWDFSKEGTDVTVTTRVRYFDRREGEMFDSILMAAVERCRSTFPNVETEIIFDGLQYENVEYSMHPDSRSLVEKCAADNGLEIVFADERGGTTAAMFAARGLKGGLCIFTGQHHIHSTAEYADLGEMADAYRLVMSLIPAVSRLSPTPSPLSSEPVVDSAAL